MAKLLERFLNLAELESHPRWIRSAVTGALCVLACSLTVAALSAGSALAGEITGNGMWIAGSETAPLNGKSPCAFSGLNDNYVLGNPVPDEDGFTHTQNWGQAGQEARAFLTSIGLNPGIACNPTRTTFGE